jgi:hypothetical protein
MAIPPIERSIEVAWSPEEAFRRFTDEFGAWWPVRKLSVGGPKVRRVVFETRAGGRIFEELTDGRRFAWGEVMEWAPPSHVRFTWHPSRPAETAQEVLLEFTAQPDGTMVKLTAGRWERWGKDAEKARKGYGSGWGYVLSIWAGKRSASRAVIDAMIGVMKFIERFRGGPEAAIARASGEMMRG